MSRELVLITAEEPTFDQWCAAAEAMTRGRAIGMVGGGWHVVDTEGLPVLTWWPALRIGYPNMAEMSIMAPVEIGEFWSDALVPARGGQGHGVVRLMAVLMGGRVRYRF